MLTKQQEKHIKDKCLKKHKNNHRLSW